jgi:hypothetical protein
MTRADRFAALCLDLIAGERERQGIDGGLLAVAHSTCRACGSIVIVPVSAGIRPAYCINCGASGRIRSLHPLGNEATWTEPAANVQLSRSLAQDMEAAAIDAAYLPPEVTQ